MEDIILLKQGEIVLKGLNKRSFEMKLLSNISPQARADFGEIQRILRPVHHICRA